MWYTEVVFVAEVVGGAVTVVTKSREDSAIGILLLGAAQRLSLLPLQQNIPLSELVYCASTTARKPWRSGLKNILKRAIEMKGTKEHMRAKLGEGNN